MLITAIGLAAIVRDARAARLSVEAPQSCVEAESLAEEVGTLIGQPLANVTDVDFRIRIAEAQPKKWRLRLETIDRTPSGDSPRVRGRREIEGSSCAELAQVAAVAVAVAVRSLRAETAAPAPLFPAKPRAPDPSTTIPAPAAHPMVAAAVRPPAPWHPALTLALAVDAGTLPSASPGVTLEGDLQRGALRLSLLASAFESQDLVRSTDVGGKFQLALGGALVCFAPRRGRWTPLACAGVELGRLAGTGLQVARPETGSTFWRAGRAEGGATVALGGNSALLLRAGLAVPLTRPEFVLDKSQFVYQPSRVAARITTGFEVGF